MPCYTIVENAVDLGTCDRTTLIDALKDLGWVPTVNGDMLTFRTEYGVAQISDGKVIMRGSGAEFADTVRDAVKQGVMAKAIQKAGKKFGWKHDIVKTAGATKVKLRRG